MVHTHKPAIIHRQKTYTYLELSERVKSLGNVLIDTYQVKRGDRVGILCQNINAFTEAQYAIPAIGAISVPMNTRLAAKEIEYVIAHSGASLLLVQQDLIDKITNKVKSSVKIIPVADTDDSTQDPYESLLASSKNRLSWNDFPGALDENDVMSINYTSGSTGKPKGVMITYRGAYLMALGMVIQDKLSVETVHLWTLPMFHCNGKFILMILSVSACFT